MKVIQKRNKKINKIKLKIIKNLLQSLQLQNNLVMKKNNKNLKKQKRKMKQIIKIKANQNMQSRIVMKMKNKKL